MKKRSLVALILVFALAFSLFGCGSSAASEAPAESAAPAAEESGDTADAGDALILQRPEDADEALAWAKEQKWDKEYTIGFANIAETSETTKVLGDFVEEACAAYGMHVIRVDNNIDGQTAVKNVDILLNQGIDGLIEFNIDQTVSGVVMEKCNAADVPVIAIDIPHEGATFFGADNAYCGKLAGEKLGEEAVRRWGSLDAVDAVLLLDQYTSGDLVRQRVLKTEDGLLKVDPNFDTNKITDLDAGVDAIKAQTDTSSFLTAHAGQKILIHALSGTQGIGALAAVETLGRTDDVILVVQNEDSFFAHIKNYPNYPEDSCWLGCVTFNLIKYGKWIAPAMREIMDTGVMPDSVYIDHGFVTRENVDELFPTWKEDLAAGIYPN